MLNAPIHLHCSHRLIHDSAQFMEKAVALLAQSRALVPSGKARAMARTRASLTSSKGGTMAPQTPLAILLIDDEPSFTSGLARLLRHEGDTVDTAANGQRALAHLQAHRYDVVLCD